MQFAEFAFHLNTHLYYKPNANTYFINPIAIMPKETDLIAFMSARVERLERDGRHGTAHVHRFALRRLQAYCGGQPLRFADLTPDWLSRFQGHLLEGGLRWNTVSTYLRALRAVYQRGVDQGLAPCRPRLFRGVYTGSRPGGGRALCEASLRRLGRSPLPEPRLEEARRLFLLLFALRGIPFVDIAYLRPCDLQGGVLSYRRRKTGTCLRVRLEPWARDLLRRCRSQEPGAPYLLPFVRREGPKGYRDYQRSLRRFNHALRLLAARCGLPEKLSSYSARHSWATLANDKNYQHELIRDAMGHSTVKVTETYFRAHADERIDEMNRHLLETVFN